VARAFQRVEARTVLLDRSTERLRKTYAETAGASACMLAGEVDLADAESVGAAVKATLDRYGRIDALVNTVGGFRGGYPVVEQGSDDWDFLLGVNLKTTLNTCRAVTPTMMEQRAGRIINVASRAALTGDAGLAAYSASKAAVLRLTESLAAELKDAGVNANCVLPGTIDTPQNRAAMPAADFARWVTPQDVAGVIVFLASDAARAITGAAIPVYGRG
jgi:NAD(P)-dependent dehydrogenase (short-subunit alcohol dehydrogenase family)